MQIFALIAVIIVSFVTVMMGLDEVPPPSRAVAPAAVSTGAGQPGQAPDDMKQAVPQAAPAPMPFPAPLTDGGGTAPIVMPDFPRAAGSTAAPKCNIEACRAAYRSFTEADCTYQPLEGPRRLCTK
jgi:hypothetical protein